MSYNVKFNLWICDKNYTKLAKINYTFLQYSQVISAVSQAYFVVETADPTLNNINFDYFSSAFTCIIERENIEVFRGEIDGFNTPGRFTPSFLRPDVTLTGAYGTIDHIALNASGIIGRMDNMIVNGINFDGSTNDLWKREFADGTQVASALNTLVSEAINRPGSPVSSVTIGTIQNPVNTDGSQIVLSSQQALYGFSYLNWIRSLAALANSDWYMDGTQFNFLNQKSVDRRDSVVWKFRKGESGNTLKGMRFKINRTTMVNSVIVAGAGTGLNNVKIAANNEPSISQFGLRERLVPARALDDPVTAQSYANTYVATNSETIPVDGIHIYPSDDHIPFGNFAMGDIVTLDVKFDFISFRRPIRVMGMVNTIDSQGVEKIHYSLRQAV